MFASQAVRSKYDSNNNTAQTKIMEFIHIKIVWCSTYVTNSTSFYYSYEIWNVYILFHGYSFWNLSPYSFHQLFFRLPFPRYSFSYLLREFYSVCTISTNVRHAILIAFNAIYCYLWNYNWLLRIYDLLDLGNLSNELVGLFIFYFQELETIQCTLVYEFYWTTNVFVCVRMGKKPFFHF